MNATYNLTDNRLKAWFDGRLSPEQYAEMRRRGFVFWHGSKCFTTVWSPWAEDLLKAHGFEIELLIEADDVEARVERFAKYAEGAESSAVSASNHLDSDRCNTERRRENAARAVEKNTELAKHWNERIAASVRHAAFKDRPDVIFRRIQGLEKDVRKHTKDKAEAEKWIRMWEKAERIEQAIQLANYDHGLSLPEEAMAAVGTSSLWSALTGGKLTLEQAREIALGAHRREIAKCDRWLTHLDRRMVYEKATLEAAGGLPSAMFAIEVGGAVHIMGRWFEVVKVNKQTIRCRAHHDKGWAPKVELSTITEYKTPAEWRACFAEPAAEELAVTGGRE